MNYISMVRRKTLISALLAHWRYHTLALSHQYDDDCSLTAGHVLVFLIVELFPIAIKLLFRVLSQTYYNQNPSIKFPSIHGMHYTINTQCI